MFAMFVPLGRERSDNNNLFIVLLAKTGTRSFGGTNVNLLIVVNGEGYSHHVPAKCGP